MERRIVVLWLDHKAKKRSVYEISLWFCNLRPLDICSVSIVSPSYHEPPASFWLLILCVELSWTSFMSLKCLHGSSQISSLRFGLQIRSQRYLLLFHNWVLQVFQSFRLMCYYLLHRTVVIFQ